MTSYAAKLVLPLLLGLVLLVFVVAIPVVAVVGTIYNSPFAVFLPPLEAGDTVTMVASSYVAEFNREIADLANTHAGYDDGKIVYVNYEGSSICQCKHYYLIDFLLGSSPGTSRVVPGVVRKSSGTV